MGFQREEWKPFIPDQTQEYEKDLIKTLRTVHRRDVDGQFFHVKEPPMFKFR